MEKRLLRVGERDIEVEVFAPVGDEPVPAILLLHELFGVLDCYREDARDLAAQGYLVYLPNLFTDGALRYCIRAMVMEVGRKNRSSNPLNQEVHAMLDAMKDDPRCNGRLGMLGQCLTGGFVLHMAQRDDMLAPVVYHHSLGLEGSGVADDEKESLQNIKLLQGHWSTIDPICPASRRKALINELDDRVEAYTYLMPHGFRSVSRKLPASAVVWQRTLDFFEQQLKDDVDHLQAVEQ